MAKDLGKNVSHTSDPEGYAYDSVVFQKGQPPLDSEMNLSQQLLADLTRKASAANSSGWLYNQEAYAQPGLENYFYTQNPSSPLPELALVNGWVVDVTCTKTSMENVNAVYMDQGSLAAGSRVDGVFLEVWRGLISDDSEGTTPSDLNQIITLRNVFTIDENIAWAIGDNGILLKTTSSGVSWEVQPSPAANDLNAISFRTEQVGYILGGSGTVFKTDNGGSSWTSLETPGIDHLRDIHILDDSTVYIVGDNGTILKSVDGVSFNLVSSGVSHNLNSIYMQDGAVGWISGDGGTYLRTLGGGDSWQKIPVRVIDPGDSLKEITLTTDFNSVKFQNLSDGWIVGDGGTILRTTDGGVRWADVSVNVDVSSDPDTPIYERQTDNFNDIEIIKSIPTMIDISIKSTSIVSSASYTLTATDLVLTYLVIATQVTEEETIPLSEAYTDNMLVDRINDIEYAGTKVFTAVKNFADSMLYPNYGATNGITPMSIQFSMGTQAFIVGDGGALLETVNGGARWTPSDSGTSYDLHGISFYADILGYVAGDQGVIAQYLETTGTWDLQDTSSISLQPQRKVFYEGNTESPADKFLKNDSVHPDIQRETSARTQIQYRIRTIEGVDINSYREAGLGSEYVYSQGPNGTVGAAGNYPYTNMGEATGDFGLWRATCRETVDGYSYAIPMFLVTRRNTKAYDVDTNINGTSVDSLGAIRPDGLLASDIVEEDIIDIRRKTGHIDFDALKEETFERVLNGNLRTSIRKDTSRGGQVGSLLTQVDTYSLDDDTLFSGQVNSEAVLDEDQIDEGTTTVGQTSIVLSLSANKMYSNNPDDFTAKYDPDSNGSVEFPGSFSGFGTEQLTFTFDEETDEEVPYIITYTNVDYGKAGLTAAPTVPLQVKSFDASDNTKSEHYLGILDGDSSKLVRYLDETVVGYPDYVEVSSTNFDEEAPLNGSSFRIHFFQTVESNTSSLQILKNYDNYFVLGVKEVRNVVDGGRYRIAGLSTESTDSDVTITLSSTYTVAAGSTIEIIAEVTSSDEGVATQIGQTTDDIGETLDAYRSPFLSVFDNTNKGVSRFYKAMLVEGTIDGTDVTPGPTFTDAAIGLATSDYVEGLNRHTIWVGDGSSFSTAPCSVTVLDGVIDTIILDSASDSTIALLPIQYLISVDASTRDTANASYLKKASQTLQPLPSEMDIEFLSGPGSMVISSLGDGGGIPSDMYDNTLNDIPISDSIVSSFFNNISGLDFSSFVEEQGHTTMPLRVSRKPSGTVTLGSPSQDSDGRTYYGTSSENLIFKTEGMLIGNPRKLMVPFLVRVKSKITSPALHGEVLLAVVTSYENEYLNNEIVIGPNEDKAVIALYKVPGMPIAK